VTDFREQEPFDWSTKGYVKPLPERILVCDMEYGTTKTQGGIIIANDDGKERGIRPRWGTVYSVGKGVSEVSVGDRVLIAHGRWTRGVQVDDPVRGRVVVRMVERDNILGVETQD
jgi:co-chaperonin GroES (HSP10)